VEEGRNEFEVLVLRNSVDSPMEVGIVQEVEGMSLDHLDHFVRHMEDFDGSVRHMQLAGGWESHHSCYRVEKLPHMMAVVHELLYHHIVLALKMALAALVDGKCFVQNSVPAKVGCKNCYRLEVDMRLGVLIQNIHLVADYHFVSSHNH
jgi:hypothetical protein